MFKSLSQFIDELTQRPASRQNFEEHELRLAAAALLVHATVIDGIVNEDEQVRVKKLLTEHFQLSDEAVRTLLIEAERREQQAVDLYGFTSKLKTHMGEADRLKLIEMMWQVVYADGVLNALEDNLVWRTAELLGVSSRDRMLLKKKVQSQ